MQRRQTVLGQYGQYSHNNRPAHHLRELLLGAGQLVRIARRNIAVQMDQLNGDVRVALPWLRLLAFLGLATHRRLFATPLSATGAWAQAAEWLALPNRGEGLLAVAPLGPSGPACEANCPALAKLACRTEGFLSSPPRKP